MKNSQRGFASLIIITIIAVIGFGSGYYYLHKQRPSNNVTKDKLEESVDIETKATTTQTSVETKASTTIATSSVTIKTKQKVSSKILTAGVNICANLNNEYNFSQCTDELQRDALPGWCTSKKGGYELKKPATISGTYRTIYTQNPITFDGKGKACECINSNDPNTAEYIKRSGTITGNQITWTKVDGQLSKKSSVLEVWIGGKFNNYLLVDHLACPTERQLIKDTTGSLQNACTCQ